MQWKQQYLEKRGIKTMALDFTALETAVTKQTTTVASVEALIAELRTSLNAEFAEDAVAQAKINSVFSAVQGNEAKLSAAISANTTP
jgi:hypothetical protein